MSLILRVDVDKPYGNSNLLSKITSKVSENYFPIPIFRSFKYLSHLNEFLEYCNTQHVPAHVYHRICTVPNKRTMELLEAGGHKLGLHAENTLSFETFSKELMSFKEKVQPSTVGSYTKHGSGIIKLGKHHYPPYEPDKYKDWYEKTGTAIYFGNGIIRSKDDIYCENGFFPNMFWLERDYRDSGFNELQDLLDAARSKDVVALIHPCNYQRVKDVSNDFKLLVKLSKEQNINWKIF